jgi:hypothetical protein
VRTKQREETVRDFGGKSVSLKQPEGQAVLFSARSVSSLSSAEISAEEQETNDATVEETVPVCGGFADEELLVMELQALLCDEEDRLELWALELDGTEEEEDANEEELLLEEDANEEELLLEEDELEQDEELEQEEDELKDEELELDEEEEDEGMQRITALVFA